MIKYIITVVVQLLIGVSIASAGELKKTNTAKEFTEHNYPITLPAHEKNENFNGSKTLDSAKSEVEYGEAVTDTSGGYTSSDGSRVVTDEDNYEDFSGNKNPE